MVMGSEETVTYLSPCAIWPETLQSSKAQTWEVVWLQRNEAIFYLIGERNDKEIARHGWHL